MGIVVQLLYATENQWLIGDNVLMPLLLWEIVEVFLLRTYVSKINFLGIIFVFLGVSQHWIRITTKIIETLLKIFKDVACFMWCFLVMHILWTKLILAEDLVTAENETFGVGT